jgi:hypothetical protein
MLSTTDAIKIQLQNLVNCHDYRVQFLLHNPSSLEAYLDKTEILFTASSTKQNIFVLLTKSADLPIVAIEVITTDLTDNTSGSSSMFVQCPEYTGCENTGYFLPLSIDFIP